MEHHGFPAGQHAGMSEADMAEAGINPTPFTPSSTPWAGTPEHQSSKTAQRIAKLAKLHAKHRADADDYPEFKASVTFAKAYATGTQIPVAVGAVMHFLYSFVLLSDTKHRDYYEEKYRNAMEVLKYGHPVIMKSSRHPIKMLKKKLTEEDVNRSGGRFSPGDWERAGGGPRDARYPTLSWVYQALRACIIEEKRPFAWKPEATTPEIIGEISRLARSKITFRHDPGM